MAPRPHGSSSDRGRYNVPVFLRAWKKLIEDQRCLSYAWTVKVDMVP